MFALRVSSHLRGGLTLGRTLDLLGEDDGDLRSVAKRIHARLLDGSEPAAALAQEPGDAWRVIAVSWAIAERSGAPAAEAIERMSDALARLEALRRRRSVLLASPRSSMVLICALPAVTVVFGELFGLRVVEELLTPVGLVLAAVGLGFLGFGILWGGIMIRAVARNDHVAGFELDLMHIALSGGTSVERAARRVVDAVAVYRARWVDLDGFLRGGRVDQALLVAKQAGVPVGAMLMREAESLRDESFATLERDAETLGVRILLPLGLCILPSFLAIGVVPVVLSMLAMTPPW